MSWSTWDLDGLDDSASERFVLQGGGRLLALGFRGYQPAEVERLSDRWSVTIGVLAPHSAQPTRGDVVIWRGSDRADPVGYAGGNPTRVLSVAQGKPGVVAVFLLEDATADERGPGDHTQWLAEALSGDRAVPPNEEWAILDYWGLRPLCPRCGAWTRGIVYGFPMGGFDDDEVVMGGCVVDDEPAHHQCSGCGHEF